MLQRRKILGFAIFCLWIFLYAGGTIISTAPYREALNNMSLDNFLMLLKSWIIVISFYTPANVVILCCLSAMMGGILKGDNVPLLNLAISGILIYLLFSSNVLVFGTQSFSDFDQKDYIKLAGMYSLGSMVIGFNEKKIAEFLFDFFTKKFQGKD